MKSQNHCATASGRERVEGPSAPLSLAAAEVGLWDWRPDDGSMRCCTRCRSICGLPASEPITLESFFTRIHPEDRERLASTLQRALGDGESCSIECRTLEGGAERWIGIEGRRCFATDAIPSIAGVVMNITARKQRALQRELLVQDLSHRITNAFAVFSAVVHFSGQSARTAEELSKVLQERIGALARAHAACSNETENDDDKDTALRAIVERELAPFSHLGRVAMSGEPTWLPPRFAMSMTLILHELATNAMKHGALRRTGGELFVRWWSQTDRRVPCTVLHWKEHSSERITPPARTGSGSALLSMFAGNVAGDISMDFQPDGLAATVVLPCDGAQRSPRRSLPGAG